MSKNPKKSKKSGGRAPENPNKEQEYAAFVLWLALPALLRGKSTIELEGLGVENELVQELLSLKTQREFAEHFGVDESQVSRWKYTAEENDDVRQKQKKWTKGLTGNVLLGLYRKAVNDGSASEVKLWMQLIEDWSEKQTLEHQGFVAESPESQEGMETWIKQKARELEGGVKQRMGQD